MKNLAIFISAELKKREIDTLLVGGACVSIYAKNRYLSMDLDFISYSDIKKINRAMEEIGFTKTSGRYFVNKKCPFSIEFPAPPAAIGKQMPITGFKKIQSLKLLTSTDCVKDRLAAFYHWNDPQSLEQALLVAKEQKINLREIHRWSKNEGKEEGYSRFLNLLRKKIILYD